MHKIWDFGENYICLKFRLDSNLAKFQCSIAYDLFSPERLSYSRANRVHNSWGMFCPDPMQLVRFDAETDIG